MSGGDDNLFARWSRRKRAAGASDGPDVPASAPARPEEATQWADEGLSEPELLKKLGLPDPDTLRPGDDFRAFMAEHVPAYLRRRALRRLWASDPVLANLDGLVDHGEDYTDAAMVPEVLTTAYRVGKGFLRDLAEPAEETEAEAPDAPVKAAAAEATAEPEAAPQAPAAALPTRADPPATAGADDLPPRPRRMTFRTG